MPGEETFEHHSYDVVVIGAGGAGLRAAIAAHDAGARTALICRSLLGKAHTVMAEGGIAAAMGNLWPEDNWQVHFRDTMRGGKLLNHWRMAELHAKEAPDRVYELEQWGALFDRTADGKISQRDFGGHRYARLAHVGDRTGLEMIRALQQRAVSLGIDVLMELTITDLLKRRRPGGRRLRVLAGLGPLCGLRGPGRDLWPPGVSASPGKSLPTRGSAPATATPWPCGPGPRCSTWSSSSSTPPVWSGPCRCGASGHRIGARRRRRAAQLRGQAVHVRLHPRVLQGGDGRQHRRGGPLVRGQAQQPPPARAAAPGRGGPGHQQRDQSGPRFAPRRRLPGYRQPAFPEFIQKRLPSMYHQFKELADVDITKEAMEIGPTCHYVMGGVEVDPDSQASVVPGLFAAGEVAGGMHGANRLGGNSLSDLLVFGKRAGEYAAEYAKGLGQQRPKAAQADIDRGRGGGPGPVPGRPGAENPYTVHQDLQEVMQDLVGIIRVEAELKEALEKIAVLRARAASGIRRGQPPVQPRVAPGP